MEKVKYPNVSLVIQGPINNKKKLDFIEHIPYYKTLFDEIIVSTYTEHLIGNSDFIDFCEYNNIIIRHISEYIGNVRNDARVGYQTLTTYTGLRAVTNPYAMKHRTDERYSNLDKLIDKFLIDDEKWVSGSLLFGPKVYRLFHAADHLFIAKTDKLLMTFRMTLDNLKCGKMEVNFSGDTNGAPEITYTKNFIRVSGEKPVDENHDYLIRKYFDIVNNSELFPFISRENGAQKIYRSIDDMGPNRIQYQTIEDILTKDYIEGHENWNLPNCFY
jgi:hypothetical protein